MNITELLSDRLKLRLIQASDLHAIHDLHALPETDEYNTLGIPDHIGETKLIIAPWIEENQRDEVIDYTFAVEQKTTGKFVGLIALKLGNRKYRRGEVWYKLHASYWGQGFSTESLRRVIDFGFEELNLHRIEAGCAVGNTGSIRVLEKAGMTREGRKRQVLPLKSGWSDNFEYAILETDPRESGSTR